MGNSKVTLGVALLPLTGLLIQGKQVTAAPSEEPSSHRFAPQQFLTAQHLGGRSLSQPIADGTLVPATVTTPEFSEYIAQAVPPITPPMTPQGDGTGTAVTPNGNTFTITGGTQAGQNLFHRFDQFNLNAGQVAHFLTHPQIEAVFSQVAGGNASYIDGLLQVSGSSADLFVLNPAGVLLGPNARLDLGGAFTAASADWVSFGQGSTEAWLNVVNGQNYGELLETAQGLGFAAVAPGSVINQGQLAVQSGESLRLVGGQVVNQGGLTAPGGEVTAVAVPGNSVVRFSDSQQLLTLDIAATPENLNTLEAEPMALPQLLAGQPQAQEASSVRVHSDGSVSLLAEASPGSLTVSGEVDVSQAAGPGGQVNLLGETVSLENTVVDASGNRGGSIRVGGDFQGQGTLPGSGHTQVSADTVLRADALPSATAPAPPLNSSSAIATTAPEGGQVIIWSDGRTEFAGMASAQGQGLVETSGQEQLAIAPTAQITTADADGIPGRWLLDPADLMVVAAGGTAAVTGGTNAPNTASTIDRPTLETALNGNNVQLQATNSIQVDTPIDTTGNANPGNLQLDAPTVDLNQPIQLNGSLSGTATTVNVGSNGSIQNGVDAVAVAGTVNLAASTYREGQEIVIDQQVRLQGQGAGRTILSGDADGDDVATADFTDNHRIIRLTSAANGSTISGITLVDGHATTGGAIQNNAARILIEDSVFENNRATGGNNSNGGAISLEDASSAVIRDTSINRNEAANRGGGISSNGDLTLENVSVSSNNANSGGGLALQGTGTTQILTSTIASNTAVVGAGIQQTGNQTLQIRQSTLLNNAASFNGAALDLNPSSAGITTDVENSTISGNSAANLGGGLSLAGGPVATLNNVTVTNNQAASGGGASNPFGGSLTLQNSIVAGNVATTNPDVNGPITSGGNNLVQNRGTSSGYIASDLADGTDPLLVSLADNGGPTLTHALRVGSPAVNASNGTALLVDQRGAAANGVRDIGAYELRDDSLSLVPSNTVQSTTVNQAFPNPISLTVTDLLGGAITGLTVTATPAPTGASATIVPMAPLVTDDNGVVSAIATANTVAGTHPLMLSAGGNTIPFTLTNLPDAPTRLNVLNGDNQSTIVNTAFANPLQVELRDQFGNTVPGATVTLTPAASGSSVIPTSLTLTTDAAGQASTRLTANTIAGNYLLGVSAGVLTNSASLINLPDAPTNLNVLNGDNQSTAVNTAFANPLQVALTDQFDNAIPGATVTLTPASSGSSAEPGSLTLTTDAAGQASTNLNANTIAGNHSLRLSAGALTNSASLSNLPDAPSLLTILGGDGQTTLINTSFADNLSAQVVDQYGNAVPGATVTFTPPANGAIASLGTLTAITNSTGQAQTSASANGIEGNYDVDVTTVSLSRNFSLTNTTPLEPPLEPPTPPVAPPPVIPPVVEPDPVSPGLLTLLNSQVSQFSDHFLRETEEESQVSREETRPLEATAPGTVTLFNALALEELDQSFSQEYSEYWKLRAPERTTIQDAQALLRRAEEVHQVQSGVLYAFFVSPDQENISAMDLTRRQDGEDNASDRLLLVLIPSTGAPIYELVDVTQDELLQQGKLFRLAVSDPEDELSYRPLAQQMHQWLLAPLEDDIQRLQLDNLLYVLDSGLRTIPLSAMMDGDEFLIERYGVSIIPSVDLLQANFDSPTPNPQTLAAGANEFVDLNDLPAVTVELDVIANRQQSTQVLFNEAFTPENLLKAQVEKRPEILHLATHAEFNAGDVASSYLQFWEKKLTLDQISQLGWKELELLILSACATAISSPEAELGFAGIAAATGVETSLGSLWSVSDIGTLALMAEFYGQLSQSPLRLEALRQAQVEMLQGRTKIMSQSLATERGDVELPAEWELPEVADFSHPFYWSGFTLVGNPWW